MTGKQTAARCRGRWPAVADALTLLAVIGVVAAGLILGGWRLCVAQALAGPG
jgi:hypothetical protein